MVKDKSGSVVNKEGMQKAEKEKLVKEIYDCKESPLAYIIEPKGSVRITDKNAKTEKDDLESIM